MILRFLHYPPQDPKHASFDDKQIGCGAHTDYGCMTILYQDLPGLQVTCPDRRCVEFTDLYIKSNTITPQVQNVDGKWVEAPPLPGTFVVNLGDMMEQWTNGTLRLSLSL
jgi:isopenicillin N synthase-like dioxygenase